MTEDSLVKLLEMVVSKVKDTQSRYSETVSPQGRAFNEVKELVESLQNQTVGCQGPFSEELPEDRTEIGWGWRVYGCENHAHIIHLKYGYIVVNKELAEKILVLGIP